jgi:hypothetical protein
MSRRAAQCLDCRHRSLNDEAGRLACLRGHKPRFYPPRDMRDVSWGWKRRCSDFLLRLQPDQAYLERDGRMVGDRP